MTEDKLEDEPLDLGGPDAPAYKEREDPRVQSPLTPLTYTIRKPVVRFVKSGELGYNQLLEVFKKALEEARLQGSTIHWDLMFDLRDSRDIRSEIQLRGLAMVLTQYKHALSGRMAMVTAGEELLAQGQKFSELIETTGQEAQVFDRVEDAEAWLRKGRDDR